MFIDLFEKFSDLIAEPVFSKALKKNPNSDQFWLSYIAALIKANDIKPYSIIITHEHSDHFHIPTLTKFKKNTPIIIPDFPNERMQKILKSLRERKLLVQHTTREE